MFSRAFKSIGRFASIAAPSAAIAASFSASRCDWFSKGQASEETYESCGVIGDGLKAEIWKRRHKNIDVLEPENVHVQLLMTRLRDAATPQKEFVHYADRLITILCETALASMDTTEIEVTTPEGNKYQGVTLEDEDKFIGVVITKDSSFLRAALERLMPGIDIATVLHSGKEGKVIKIETPEDVAERTCILVDAVIASPEGLKTTIRALQSRGVEQGNIKLVSLTMSEQVADMLIQFPEVDVVTASIDENPDDRGFIKPGVGPFHGRYTGAHGPPSQESAGSRT